MKKIQFSLLDQLPKKLNDAFDTLVLPAFQGSKQPEVIAELGLKETLTQLMDSGDFSGENGQTLLMSHNPNLPTKRVLWVGFGKKKNLTVKPVLSALQAAAKAIDHSGAQKAFSALTHVVPESEKTAWAVYQNALTLQNSFYDYEHESRGQKPRCRDPKLEAVTYLVPKEKQKLEAVLAQAQATAEGMILTRDLANMPSNYCTPLFLAETAAMLAEQHQEITVNILEEADCEKLDMGAFLAVAQGSETPAKFITLSYQGGKQNEAPIALVGKGITFDTGGISIKPGAAMDEMKYDMAGGAAVLGVFKALGELKPNLNVVGVIPATENMPSGKALKPGDVIRSMSGQTIEVLNTDAEGRLILCDALTYAQQTFKPSKVIDIATLTGACIIALGHHISGLMSNDEDLAQAILAAGNRTYDRFWQLPLSEEYDEQLKSNFADMANIGGRAAGTITAGQFLQRFIKKVPWAHCDIAGTAWVSGENKGATGRPVPAMVEFLLNQAQ
ncbi:leucyl aminopeptidase [Galenea microaerophila]